VDDWAKGVWGNVASPGIRCEKKRKEREVGWMEKLAVFEGVGRGKTKRLKITDSSPCPSPKQDKLLTHMSTTPNSAIRPVLGVKPLGPLFNIAESLPTPPPSNPVRCSPRGALRENEGTPASPLKLRLAKRGTSPYKAHSRQASGSGGMVNVKPKEDGEKLPLGGELMPPVSISTPPSCRVEPQLSTPLPSADFTRKVYSSKPIVKFVQDAFVWFAQPCNAPCPPWRPPAKELLAGAYRLHSLESLLTGCGWQGQGMNSSRIKRGVIFIDESTIHGRSWKDYALKTLHERYELLTRDVERGGIWVFDAKLLGYEALEMTEGGVERLVLWRFD
jgi:DNA ligase-4